MTKTTETTPFVLTMLGTDTVFTPELKKGKKKPVKKGDTVFGYPKGETLSIVSSLVQTTEPAQTDNKKGVLYPYQAKEVVVVNGPNTEATNVGDKIALGVAASLKAIAQGQVDINIIAHSRGSVESILIAHELEAIQNMIGTCSSIDEVLKQLTTQQTERHKGKGEHYNNTPDIIKVLKTQLQLIPQDQQEAWFTTLKENMPKASINFFGIDPVPGDINPITWYDPRFFILPKIIKNAEIVYYENERSVAFTPIYPEAATAAQKFVRNTMPGHHGIGSSGSNASQQGYVVSPDNTKSTHVQKLMLYKILDFLTQQGVTFKDVSHLFEQHVGLGAKSRKILADAKTIDGINDVSTFDFSAIYSDLYAKIAKNREAYKAFNNTNYPVLGWGPREQRKVLRSGHIYGLLSDVFSFNSDYINEEHARLMQDHFFKMFRLDKMPDTLAQVVDTTRDVLEKNILLLLGEKPKDPENLNYILLATTLHNKDARADVLNACSKVIQHISQQYLTNDWSSPEKEQEKLALLASITSLLTKFDELSKLDNDMVKDFVGGPDGLTQLSLTGITNTITQQHKDLEEHFHHLQEPENARFTRFINGLIMQINEEGSESKLAPKVAGIIESTEFMKMTNQPLENKITYILTELEKIAPEEITRLTELFKEKFTSITTTEELIKSFADQYQEDSLEDFEHLFQQMQILKNDIIALHQLAPSEKTVFDQYELSLLQKTQALITTAAQKFYKDKPLHALPELGPEGSFKDLAERYAIKHYGLVDRVKEKNEALKKEKETLEEQVQSLIKQNTKQKQITEDYHQALNDEREAEFLLLIRDKLQPLTQDYLKLLQDSKSPEPEKKIELVNKLLKCLNDSSKNSKPSARVTAFYTQLNTGVDQLKLHRDPDLKRYIRTALIVGGILITGILPGLLVLLAYSKSGNTTGKSPYFWKSAGENVTDKLLKDAKTAPNEEPEAEPKGDNRSNNSL